MRDTIEVGMIWTRRLIRSYWQGPPILVLSGVAALCAAPGCSQREPQPSGLTDTDALNATYESEFPDSGLVALRDGRFTEPVGEGSASRLTVDLEAVEGGDLDGDGRTDIAAVLVTRPGGSGVFSVVHALLWRAGEASPAGSALLGDRIRLQSVRIEGSIITVRLLDRHERQPYADEPTVPVVRQFAVRDGLLAELAAP